MKRLFTIISIMCLSVAAYAQKYTWKAVPMDGSRTGCRYAMQDDVDEAIGTLERGAYTSPGGAEFKKNSMVAKTASLVIAAQPAMYEKKAVVGFSDHEIIEKKPESELSNLIVDLLMAAAEEATGKKVHMGLLNYGGIRSDLPEGKILVDDVESMLPFNNYLVVVEHKGSEIRKLIEGMAAGNFQATGGVKVVVEDRKVVSLEIDGEPLDDDKVYAVATITFLLDGGDGFCLGKDALSMTMTDVLVRQPVMTHIVKETEAGRKIGYKKDGRVIIRK